MLTPKNRALQSLQSIRRNRWNKDIPVSQRIRSSLSLAELVEVKQTAARLRKWAEAGYPNDIPHGAPRKYFTLDRYQLEAVLKECPLSHPDFSLGFNTGWAFDGAEAWRITIKLAYAPGYFWVAVQAGKFQSGRNRYDTYAFHCPWREQDVLAAVEKLKPAECPAISDFRWMASTNPPTMAMPWPVGRVGTRLCTFFGWDEVRNIVHVGVSSSPAQRCGYKSLALIGASGLRRERVEAKLMEFNSGKPFWYTVNERSLAAVAKMAAKHARRELLES